MDVFANGKHSCHSFIEIFVIYPKNQEVLKEVKHIFLSRNIFHCYGCLIETQLDWKTNNIKKKLE